MHFSSVIHAGLHLVSGLLVAAVIAQSGGVPAYAAPNVPSHESRTATSTGPTSRSFERFRHQTDAWKILQDEAVKTCIKSVMGNDEEEFWGCAQLAEPPTVSGDDLLVVACVRGLCPFMKSVLSLNVITGKCCACYLTDSKMHVYGASSIDELPKPLRVYLTEHVSAAILFEKPDWTRKTVTKPPVPRKKLKLNGVTGTYEREDSSRFIQATLKIRALPGSKIAFNIEATNGGNTGEAQGTVPIINHRAVYKEGVGKLEFLFKENTVVLTGNDAPFGGMAVTLLGTYRKTDDTPPKDVL